MKRKRTIYELLFKRPMDFILSLLGIIILSPVIIVVAILVKVKLGGPIIFSQERPGRYGKPFKMYKFRSMTNEKDKDGNLLPDEDRLTKFGKKLRSTSLDELPGLFNILKGNMSIVGPRPHLIKDMWFMTEEENNRHLVRPGLTGLAQVKGRNSINWEEKFDYDLKYIQKISFFKDILIMLQTFAIVFKKEGISNEGMETHIPLGEYRVKKGEITEEEYQKTLKYNSLEENK